MKKLLIATCWWLLPITTTAFAQTPMGTPSTNPSAAVPATPATVLTDSQIAGVVEAANKGEIEAAKLADGTSKTKSIKDFAQMMISEHSMVNKDLKALASRAKLKMADSETRSQLMNSSKTSMKQLKALKGADFDKAYASDQVNAHQTVLDSLDSTLIPNAKNPELKTMLTKVRESVAMHLDKAKALSTSVSSQI